MLRGVIVEVRRFAASLRQLSAMCLMAQLISCAKSDPAMSSDEDEEQDTVTDTDAGGAAAIPTGCPERQLGFAEEVIAINFGEGESFGQDQLPEIVLGEPLGGGCCAGSFDVVSLGNGGSITLGFGQRRIINGAGVDFIVFENPFLIGGDPENVFVEFGQVEVSEDGSRWLAFPCNFATGAGCAGRSPTLANPDHPEINAFDPNEAGGDAFDLADVGLESAQFVRVSDIPEDEMGFDLDAVALVHGSCE